MGIVQIKKHVAPCIIFTLVALFFAPLLAFAGANDEQRNETVPVFDEISQKEDVVSKKEVEDSAFVVPPPKIQIPVFEKGRWKGYREEPVPLARALSSNPDPSGPADTLSPVRRPIEPASSVN